MADTLLGRVLMSLDHGPSAFPSARHRCGYRSFLALVGTLVTVAVSTNGATQPAFSPLFNGHDLDGWQVADGKDGHVEVVGGTLRLTGDSGWLLTKDDYYDFVLQFEAKAASKSIGGVLVRVLAERRSVPVAYEVRLADGQGRAGVLLHHVRGQALVATTGDPMTVPTTEDWQSYRVECHQNRLEASVAGRPVLRVQGLLQNVGRVGLQVTEGVIEFRNIELLKIEAPTREPPAGVLSPIAAGVNLPRLRREVKPQYTRAAMAAGVQGDVFLEAVVLADGTVGDVKVVRSLVADLDAQAVKAAKQWKFHPATRDGQPVAVLVTISMSFKLR